jgi:hypothetical protein
MNFRNRGSLTVEAVLILPMFMALILFLSYFIKAYYVHDIIQDALTESVMDVSSMSYPYYLSGALEFKGKVNSIAEERTKAVQEHFEPVQELIESIQGAKDSAQAGDAKGVGTSILAGKEKLMDVKSAVQSFNPKELIRMLAAEGASRGLNLTQDVLVNQILKADMANALTFEGQDITARMDALGIEGGLDGLDFSGSKFFSDGDMLDVEVQYKLKKADPFGIIRDVPMKSRVVTRAWLAGVNEKGEEEAEAEEVDVGKPDPTEDAKKVYRTCYILADSKTSVKYHFADCPNLRVKGDKKTRRTVVSVQVPFVKTSGEWEPEGSAVEYNGKSYSFCENCKKGYIKMKTPPKASD